MPLSKTRNRSSRHHDFARRRIYDTRTALRLTAFGVTGFATLNLKDFQNFGFQKVWNPLATP